MLGSQYKSVNFGAGKIPASPKEKGAGRKRGWREGSDEIELDLAEPCGGPRPLAAERLPEQRPLRLPPVPLHAHHWLSGTETLRPSWNKNDLSKSGKNN